MKKFTTDDLEMVIEELQGYQGDADMMAKNGELTDKQATGQKEAFQVSIEALQRLIHENQN